jgi:hypothetical protein
MDAARDNHPYCRHDNTSLHMFSSSSSSTSSSHDDFAPQRKVVEDGEEDSLKLIQEHVDNNPIMLYMKGNPSMPMCKLCTIPILGVSHGVLVLCKREFACMSTYVLIMYVFISRWFFGSNSASVASRVLTLVVSMSWTIQEFVKGVSKFKKRGRKEWGTSIFCSLSRFEFSYFFHLFLFRCVGSRYFSSPFKKVKKFSEWLQLQSKTT